MVLKLCSWIVFAVVNSSFATDVVSWKHESQGLQQMVPSGDDEYLFVATDAEVFGLHSSNLRKIDTYTSIDGLLTVLLNNDLNTVTFCSNGTERCRKYRASNITDGRRDAGYKIRTRNAKTLVTRDNTIFFACPHEESYSASIEDEPCSAPGIFWMNQQTDSRYQASIHRRIRFKTESPLTVTEKYFAAFDYERFRWFLSKQRRGNKLSTRIAQLCNCQAACSYQMQYTYVDMEVLCGNDAGMVMSDIAMLTTNETVYLVAAFQSSTFDKSAICIYPSWEIKQRFIQNFNVCYKGGRIDYQENYISQAWHNCRRNIYESLSGDEGLCYGLNSYHSVIGNYSLKATPILTYNLSISSITVVEKEAEGIAFMGTTRNGHILKAVVYPAAASRKLPFNLSLGYGKAVNEDVHFEGQVPYSSYDRQCGIPRLY